MDFRDPLSRRKIWFTSHFSPLQLTRSLRRRRSRAEKNSYLLSKVPLHRFWRRTLSPNALARGRPRHPRCWWLSEIETSPTILLRSSGSVPFPPGIRQTGERAEKRTCRKQHPRVLALSLTQKNSKELGRRNCLTSIQTCSCENFHAARRVGGYSRRRGAALQPKPRDRTATASPRTAAKIPSALSRHSDSAAEFICAALQPRRFGFAICRF